MAMVELPSLAQALAAVLLPTLLYFIYFQLTTGESRRRLVKEHGCLPVRQYPVWDPFFGIDLIRNNVRALKEHRLLHTTFERFKEMGQNTFGVNVMGQRAIITLEPENLKTIQSLDFKHWGLGNRRKTAFIPLLGEGIFTTDGAAWHRSREMLRPNFVRNQVADLRTFETHVDHLIQAIPLDRSTVDLQELFFRLTLDSATEFLFGESTDSLAPGTTKLSAARFAEAFNRSQDSIGRTARFGPLSALVPDSEFKKDAKFVHDFVDGFVNKGLAYHRLADAEKGENRYVFLHELVKQTQDKVQIRSELLNILLAGRDTTASLLSNVWFELSKRPDIWAKLRAEVDQLGGERPDYAQIKDMKYLRFVLNESLRLYPVVPANSREALCDTVLPLGGGPDGKSPVLMKKGNVAVWSLYAMHRRKDFYGPDAEEFRPERWEYLRPGWEYLPFNGGPRICIGQQLALTEASYTTIRLMQEFSSIESRDPLPWQESLTLSCTGLGGAKVSLTPAEKH